MIIYLTHRRKSLTKHLSRKNRGEISMYSIFFYFCVRKCKRHNHYRRWPAPNWPTERRKNNEDGKYYCTRVGALAHNHSLAHTRDPVRTQPIHSHNTTNDSQTGDASKLANVYHLDPCLFRFVCGNCLLTSCRSNVVSFNDLGFRSPSLMQLRFAI